MQLDYVEITAAVTITSTTDGASGGTAVIDGNAITYDGNLRIRVEFYAPYALQEQNVDSNLIANLYDGTADLGRLCNMDTVNSGTVPNVTPFYGVRFLTPSAGSHTYHIRGWKTNSGSTSSIGAGAGGSAAYMPAFMRITVA
jgi:hypothetical protein